MKFASIVLLALGSLLASSNVAEAQEICWRVCFPEKPKCPEEWSPKKLGHCWTCCKDNSVYFFDE
ncbi:hypothetical protein RO3G_06534 [Rhizopus delemar RA 99-880]|uniref:Uncharacterized protein n=1 Tax=Rhizopus delemar (strain RA 99-880 / ATCC MYA-4621 / FGSC 9543 / NRRL 43880) TaxID=246409 RepID=I1C049_RHIO9|nr:hypothetical protein RO3G_06528 [Rhizopus delemar RA 99-880]EIE81829.1 hypothetical protein RO3G_06534 [Rhizopus delemar RA 99-880]|eukprot:EIE81823.1 hypothetical protein RO3G_06528 [Rhizopus delemar RA 99-880]